MTTKSLVCLVLSFLIVVSFSLVSAAPAETTVNANVSVSVSTGPAIQPVGTAGGINWESNVIEALGVGVPPANAVNPAQAKGMARRAAVVDAQRNLLETINGVQVDGSTTMENLMITSDVVKTKVAGVIKGYRIVKEGAMPDGSYQVLVAVKLFGNSSVAEAISDVTKPAEIKPVPQPSTDYKPVVATPVEYSGLVIDARGLGLDRSMAPMVYDESGRVIYGNMYVDHAYVVANGLVDYAASPGAIELVESGQSRAGKLPVTVKAIKLQDFNRNVVISNADADKVLAASGPSGFLLKCSVVFEH